MFICVSAACGHASVRVFGFADTAASHAHFRKPLETARPRYTPAAHETGVIRLLWGACDTGHARFFIFRAMLWCRVVRLPDMRMLVPEKNTTVKNNNKKFEFSAGTRSKCERCWQHPPHARHECVPDAFRLLVCADGFVRAP